MPRIVSLSRVRLNGLGSGTGGPPGFGGEFGAVGDPEFGVDVGQVGLDGAAAHEQACADVGVAQPFYGQPYDALLGWGEAGPAGGRTVPLAAGPPGVGDGLWQGQGA